MAHSPQDTLQLTPFTWTPKSIAQACNGQWFLLSNDSITSTRIHTDTRSIKTGDVFLAIQGDNFDGHAYLEQAKQSGASLAIVNRVLENIDIPQCVVTDTKIALGLLGNYVRERNNELKVIAITGSMGKTTCKEMLGSILSMQAPTLITRGNLNNDLGVPMMLLELCQEHKYAVMELGANHLGEIAYTTQLVQPHVACVLNIGTAHMGEFGGRDNICTTKAEIFQGLQDYSEKITSTAVVPAVDDYSEQLLSQAQQYTNNVSVFGKDVTASNVQTFATYSTFELHFPNCAQTTSKPQPQPVTLHFAGSHNVTNAVASASCAFALGIAPEDIARGLTQAQPPKGRLNHIQHFEHTFIDDSYNANPDAMLAGAQVLVQTAIEVGNKRKNTQCNQKGNEQLTADKQHKPLQSILVIGDIGELGEHAVDEHSKLGSKIGKLIGTGRLNTLYCVGDLMANCAKSALEHAPAIQVRHFADKETLVLQLQQDMQQNTVVALFKGSRFMAMETIVSALQK